MQTERRAGFPARGARGIGWLGQAGFWIETGRHGILIDPYLSDSLARKYVGRANDHRRMMPVPVEPAALPRPDLVLITHAHTDHMDPDTLAPLARRFPDVQFVVPRSKMSAAAERIGGDARLVGLDAGETLRPLRDLTITAFPAAHETLEKDDAGRHVFLGYGIAAPRFRLYHSGDTIPFDGLVETVSGFRPDIALLPVNGRDAQRLAAGIPGNLTLAEAIALCREAGIPYLIPHHFGMFAFNTISPAEIDRVAETTHDVGIERPRVGEMILWHEGRG